jgi:hypothetical protein
MLTRTAQRARAVAATVLAAWLWPHAPVWAEQAEPVPAAPAPAEQAEPVPAAPAPAEQAEPAPVEQAEPAPAAPARAEAPRKRKKKKKRQKRRQRPAGWQREIETSASARAGALQGLGTRRAGGAMQRVDADAEIAVEHGAWGLGLPLDASHRETQGASLDETGGSAGLELRYRHGPELRLAIEASISGMWRPDWPDQYQPLGDGSYLPTDRYSHWDRQVGATVAAIPLRHHHARAEYGYTLADYRQDPNFDPVNAPNHLVPSDHEQHTLDLSWRYFGDGWKAGVAADAFLKNYFFAFSRDAGTGLTHANPGGVPPNPLQQLRGVEPALSFEREWMGGDLELGLSYGYEIQQDTFQGYYSYTGHHPAVDLMWMVRPGHELRSKAWVTWRTYGPDSYAAGPGHPPLAYGDRRVERRGAVSLGYRMRIARGLHAVADGDLIVRRTNFPPYEPGVFPSTRLYDIDWSYTNWSLLAGLEYEQ